MRQQRFFILFIMMLMLIALNAQLLMAQDTQPGESPVVERTQTLTPDVSLAPPAEATEDIDLVYETYSVRPGDSLAKIAAAYGVTTRELAELNDISNPSLIFVGQKLNIPGTDVSTARPTPTGRQDAVVITPTATPAPNTEIYVVQENDTLLSLSIRFGTSVRFLQEINDFTGDTRIYQGQQIAVPVGSVRRSNIVTDSSRLNNAPFGTGIEVLLTDDLETLAEQITTLGVDWVKLTVDWAVLEPTQGTFAFDELDAAIEALDTTGANILITLIGAPDWARPDATEYVRNLPSFYGPPQNLNHFEAFANALATQYTGVVDAYEIWSAPNLRRNWINPQAALPEDGGSIPTNAGFAPVRYIDLLEAGYTGIKAADENARVITAGLAPTGYNDFYNAIDTYVFLDALLKQGALNFSDAIGVQIEGYRHAPDTVCCGTGGAPGFDESYHFYFQNVLDDHRALVDRNGGQRAALWITRFGWGTPVNALAEPNPAEQLYLNANTPLEQAQYIENALNLANTTGYVGPTILYNLNGCSAGNEQACFYSLIDALGGIRPAFDALAQFNTGRVQ